ncbi:hypothetical protein AOZ06_39285 [Kibdelosporangium phytohabitans]|uniref:DUF4328 domain-containing protein n=1 Tax=Kibdelosporangium phytohabitans TaxID=860235 RepID=A0A0N9IBN3_9PSEU|nr:hypothetical protein AOZ06_39285 [Kibdelosporangium phytohabitans]
MGNALVPALTPAALLLTVTSAVVTLVWMYRARRNVRAVGRQRHAPGWAIGGWFCPIVNLWFPVQIVSDIATADQPSARSRTYAVIRSTWWVCWLAAWASGVQYQETRSWTADGDTSVSHNLAANFGGTLVSRAFGAAAAFLLAVLVRSRPRRVHWASPPRTRRERPGRSRRANGSVRRTGSPDLTMSGAHGAVGRTIRVVFGMIDSGRTWSTSVRRPGCQPRAACRITSCRRGPVR